MRRSLAVLLALLGVAPLAVAAPTTYAVDEVHSALLFRIKHLNVAYTYGRFNDFAGTFVVDDEDLANAKVDLTVQMASVDTGDAKRDQHLRSPDFFDANQFPTMRFESTSVAKEDVGAYTVTGNLNLHGVTKPVTVMLKKTGEGPDPWGGQRIGFEGAFSIKRSDHGMANMLQAVGDTVWITVAVEGKKQ